MLNIRSFKKEIFIFFLVFLPFFKTYGDQSAEEAFTDVYKYRIWGTNEVGEGTSGSGSTLAATELYRSFLQDFLRVYNIHSVVDFGCGDWGFSKAINWEGINYTGLDVVKMVVEKNQRQFTKPNVNFFHANGLEIDLPPADLLICKEVLQHLTNEDIMQFMAQLHKFKYCLLTNDVNPWTQTSDNPNINRGGYRWIDLTMPPFNIQGIKILAYISEINFKQVLLIINNNAL